MVYNYTKPRGPLAAEYSSPGPCYLLPGLFGQKTHDPRSVHMKGPAFPFGTKHGKFKDDCSPGPCYLPPPNLSRYGKDGTPQYSLYGRQKDLFQDQAPGPGAYSPDRSMKFAYKKSAEYTFGSRPRLRRQDKTPAANSYTLDGMMGQTVQSGKRQAPSISISGRSKIGGFHEDLQKTPGPGTYNTTHPDCYRIRGPHYSMTSRNVMPGDSTTKPGPGAHSPENVTINKKAAAKFSFGIRHSEYTAPVINDVID